MKKEEISRLLQPLYLPFVFVIIALTYLKFIPKNSMYLQGSYLQFQVLRTRFALSAHTCENYVLECFVPTLVILFPLIVLFVTLRFSFAKISAAQLKTDPRHINVFVLTKISLLYLSLQVLIVVVMEFVAVLLIDLTAGSPLLAYGHLVLVFIIRFLAILAVVLFENYLYIVNSSPIWLVLSLFVLVGPIFLVPYVASSKLMVWISLGPIFHIYACSCKDLAYIGFFSLPYLIFWVFDLYVWIVYRLRFCDCKLI